MFGFALLANPLVRRAIFGGLLILAIVGAAFAAIKHYEAKGAEAQREWQHKVDQAYIDRGQEQLAELQTYFDSYLQGLAKSESVRGKEQQKIAQLSAALDRRPCLDAAGAGWVLQFAPKQPGLRGAPEGAKRPAAGSAGGSVR